MLLLLLIRVLWYPLSPLTVHCTLLLCPHRSLRNRCDGIELLLLNPIRQSRLQSIHQVGFTWTGQWQSLVHICSAFRGDPSPEWIELHIRIIIARATINLFHVRPFHVNLRRMVNYLIHVDDKSFPTPCDWKFSRERGAQNKSHSQSSRLFVNCHSTTILLADDNSLPLTRTTTRPGYDTYNYLATQPRKEGINDRSCSLYGIRIGHKPN